MHHTRHSLRFRVLLGRLAFGMLVFYDKAKICQHRTWIRSYKLPGGIQSYSAYIEGHKRNKDGM